MMEETKEEVKDEVKVVVIQPDDLHIEIEDLLERKFNIKEDKEGMKNG